jgi:hypothetical protein
MFRIYDETSLSNKIPFGIELLAIEFSCNTGCCEICADRVISMILQVQL